MSKSSDTATIESAHNPRLQGLRRLQRRRERAASGRFLAEGEDLIAAAAQAGWEPLEGYRAAGTGLGGARFCDVRPAALAAVSALGSGTRAIGVYDQRWSPVPLGPLCVYLHGLADPGNVGSVLRSAGAFGASCVALGPGCADPYSPKAVRASMGAIFAVALARVDDPAALPGALVALAAHAGQPLRELTPTLRRAGALSLLVGAERDGLPAELLAGCEHVAHIPIHGDSLNAATAAAIALYELGERADSQSRPPRPAGRRQPAPPSRVQAS